MSSFQPALEKMFDPSKGCSTIGTNTKIGDGSIVGGLPVNISYCCDISERKDVSTVRHGLLVWIPCARRLVLLNDVRKMLMARCRTTWHTKPPLDVFADCMEELTSTQSSRKKRIQAKRQGERKVQFQFFESDVSSRRWCTTAVWNGTRNVISILCSRLSRCITFIYAI